MNPILRNNLSQSISKSLFVVIAIFCTFNLQSFGGEKKEQGGNMFDMGLDILNSTIGRSNGSGNAVPADDIIMGGLGTAQGLIVNAASAPLTNEEKIIAGREAHQSFKEEFNNALRQPTHSKDPELMTAWQKLGLQKNFHLYVIERDVLNAFTHVGGYIYVYGKLLDVFKPYPNALAFILAHEASHNLNGDVEQYFAIYKGTNGIIPGGGEIARLAYGKLFMAYSQQEEYEADERAMKIILNAGYSKKEALRTFSLLSGGAPEDERSQNASLSSIIEQHFSTHPLPSKRRMRLEEESK